MTITTDWLKARGFIPLGGLSEWWELRVRGVDVRVDVEAQTVNVGQRYSAELPIPFTCEALDTLIGLLTPKPKTIFDLYMGDKWVAILRRQESGRWLSLAYDGAANTWAWLSVANGPTNWVPRDDLPTTGMIAVITDVAELSKYPLE